MNGTQVGILEKANKICFRSLLQSKNSARLKTQIGLKILRNLAYQPLEWEFADEQLRRLLITANFSQSDSSCKNGMSVNEFKNLINQNPLKTLLAWAVTMWLLHASRCRCRLARSFGGKLLARCLPSGRFTSSLLGTSHFVLSFFVVKTLNSFYFGKVMVTLWKKAFIVLEFCNAVSYSDRPLTEKTTLVCPPKVRESQTLVIGREK